MKILYSALLLLVLTVSGSFADTKKYFYYGPDGKTYLDVSKEKILVRFEDNTSFAEQASVLSRESELQALAPESVLPSPHVALARLRSGLTQEKIEALLARLNGTAGIIYANPFLVYEDGTLQGIQDKFLVGLKDASQLALLQQTAERFHVIIDGQDEFDNNLYHLSTTRLSGVDAMELANKFFETGLFRFAEPDFLRIMKVATPDDTYLNNQWELNNTGTNTSQYGGIAGCDLNVFNAWTISTGSSSIKIAIIDEGVQLTHEDLSANLLPGYDASGMGSAGGPNSSDAHGTNCAGIAAAVGNNAKGIAGIAYGCKIVPIRLGYESPPGSGSLVTSDSWISNCFNYAWSTAGADVISNSWGGGSSSSTINNAISTATTSGRGGKGSAVLFSAGNTNTSVQYPATLSTVISVAAMSMCNKRKSTSSCDGENFWGSSFGTNLDVAGPGVKIYTTDLIGSAGYSSTNYYSAFNGTSSACPAIAGVMGLLYSVNPNLTLADARFYLESTCQKTGGYTYSSNISGQPNGTWSTDLGYGRVDAYAALQAALGTAGCGVPSALSATGITTSSANLSWNGVSGAISYNVQYKPTASGTWISTTSITSSTPVTGLSENTQYEFQVQTVCSSSSGSFSASALFTTLSTIICAEGFEPNNTKATAQPVSANTNIVSQISSSTDKDWFSFSNTSTQKNIRVTLTALPANYNLELYKPGGAKIATSANAGTTDEQINFNTSIVGSYKVRIFGASGAFSNSQCYTFLATISSTPFKLDDAGESQTVSASVYPNPTSGNMTVAYTSLNDGNVNLYVLDVTGKVRLMQSGKAYSGMNTYQLDLNHLNSGVYFLEIKNGDEITHSKFIIGR